MELSLPQIVVHLSKYETEGRPWLIAVSPVDPHEVYGKYAALRGELRGDLPDQSTPEGREKAVSRLLELKRRTREATDEEIRQHGLRD